ncbi:MAG: TonB-dependent receptor plug domain-containing protein [Bacteroides fragilis]
MDEVVVVGYGVQKKESQSNRFCSINQCLKLESRSVTPVFHAALAGQIPGVTSIQTSGAPGSQTGSITIRGKNSINAASPLVIVDGVPGTMDTADPSDDKR